MKYLTILLYGSALLLGYSPAKNKMIRMASIDMTWHFSDHELCLDIESPAQGWIAVGFNSRESLTGSNLFMATLDSEMTICEDQFITAPGIHPRVESMGGKSNIVSAVMQQIPGGGCQLTLKISTEPSDHFHKNLAQGQKTYLTLAYSESTDFNHHSRRRESTWITL